jgi:hypothetical protein
LRMKDPIVALRSLAAAPSKSRSHGEVSTTPVKKHSQKLHKL